MIIVINQHEARARWANSEEESYFTQQKEKEQQEQKDLQWHIMERELESSPSDPYGSPFDRPVVCEKDLLYKLQNKGMETQFSSFVDIKKQNEQKFNKLKQLNEEFTRKQKELTESISSNRRKMHQIRSDLQWEIPEISELEGDEFERYQSKFDSRKIRDQTRGAATQRVKEKDIVMEELTGKNENKSIENEIEMETKIRDERFHGKSGLKRYNNSKKKGLEFEEKSRRRSNKGGTRSATKSRAVTVRIKSPDSTTMRQEKGDQEQHFKREMKKLHEKEKQWGLKSNRNTSNEQIIIKPPTITPIRPVAPVFEVKNQVSDADLREDLINIVNSDNELKKQKAGMVVERHQQVTTPLKQDSAPELRTSVEMLKKLDAADLEKINQILGQVGGKLDDNGIFGQITASQTAPRVQAPRVGNQDQVDQQQQQQVRHSEDLVPRDVVGVEAGVAAGGGASRRVCANVVGNNEVCANVVGNASGQAAGSSGAATNISSYDIFCVYVCLEC